MQHPGIHDPLAVVQHGDKRGVQSVAGQLHDGAVARHGLHPGGPDTGLGPGHDGQPAVDAHHERDVGHHADIAHVHAAHPAAAGHRLRARHRPAGGETGRGAVRGQTVHVLLFRAAGQAHQGQDTHALPAGLSVAHAHHAVHVRQRLVPDRARGRRAQHAVRDRHRRALDHAPGLQQGAAAGEDPRPGAQADPAQGTVPVLVVWLLRGVRRTRRRDLLVQETRGPSRCRRHCVGWRAYLVRRQCGQRPLDSHPHATTR